MAVNRDLIGQAATMDRTDRVVLAMDSGQSPVHGRQDGGACNGHFESVCHHPPFMFNSHGNGLGAKLQPENVSSADDWDESVLAEADHQQADGPRGAFCADPAFAKPGIYEAMETRGVEKSEKCRRASFRPAQFGQPMRESQCATWPAKHAGEYCRPAGALPV
jgi:hypothetical protein